MTKTEYLLVCLAEEAAEIAHAASKALRFGPDHEWPGTGETNRRIIGREIGDLLAVAEMLGLELWGSDKAAKREKLAKYMDLSRELGTLKKRGD